MGVASLFTSHIRQVVGGVVRGTSYCVPQVKHIARSALSKCIAVFVTVAGLRWVLLGWVESGVARL
jgi:hypothetical protein